MAKKQRSTAEKHTWNSAKGLKSPALPTADFLGRGFLIRADWGRILWRECLLDLLSNGFGYLALQGEDAARRAFVNGGPNIGLTSHLDQLDIDAYTASLVSYTAL